MRKISACYPLAVKISAFIRENPRLKLLDGMSFGVEDHLFKVERTRRREQQVEVFKSFGEEETLHLIVLLFRHHTLQPCVRIVSAAVLHKVAPELLAHAQVLLVFRVAIKKVSGFNNLGPKRISGRRDLPRPVIKLFRLDAFVLPHPERRLLQQLRTFQIARKRQYCRKERVECAVRGCASCAGVHVGVAVPQLDAAFVAYFIRQILVDGGNAFGPHPFAVRIAKQQRALQKVLVITVDRAADVTIGIGPLAGLDIDPLANQSDLRAAVVGLNERTLGLFEKDWFAGELAQRAKLDNQRARFRRVADRLTYFAGLQVDVAIRHAGWRAEDWQQSITEVFGEIQKALVTG